MEAAPTKEEVELIEARALERARLPKKPSQRGARLLAGAERFRPQPAADNLALELQQARGAADKSEAPITFSARQRYLKGSAERLALGARGALRAPWLSLRLQARSWRLR